MLSQDNTIFCGRLHKADNLNKSYSTGYPYGAIKQLTKYDEGIVSPLYICFAPKAGTNTAFYTQYFEGSRYNREIYRFAQEGARNHGLLNIAVEDFFTGTLVEPNPGEQQKIAEILATCDKVIELKQKLLEKMQQLKKLYMKKLFPQNGENTPEIRFTGFTGNWQQRKYSEVIHLLSGQDFEPENYNDEGKGTPYLTGASCIENGHTTSVRWTETPRCIVNKRDTVLVCKGSGYGTIAVVEQEKAHIARQFMALIVKDDMLMSRFNYWLLHSVIESIKTDARGLIAGIARDAVLNQDIYICSIDEQAKVGQFLDALDNTIALYQRELEEEQQKKKALMQLLLTGLVRVNA